MKKRFCINILSAMVLSLSLLTGCGGSAAEDATAADTGTTTALSENEAGQESTLEDAGSTATTEIEIDDYELKIGSLKGPTTIGLLHMMDRDERNSLVGNYTFSMETDPAQLSAGIVGGELDIALLPANLACVLYNRTNAGVSVIEINTLGVLECVSSDESIEHIADLKGKTVLTTGQGATPEYVLRYLLAENNVTDCKIEFHAESAEIAALLQENPDQIAILPQPFATSAVAQNDALRLCFSLTEEWDALDTDSTLITGVTVVRNEILEEHPNAVAMFMQEHAASVRDVTIDPHKTAKLTVAQEIIGNEDIAIQAIPRCGVTWITGTEMETLLAGYLKVLYTADAASVGGTLPTSDFYYDIIGK